MPNRTPIREVCARVARSLLDARVAKEMSMTRVAEGAGLSRQMVSYVEAGKRIPTLDTLLRIARVLEIDLGEVIRRAERGE